VLAEQATTTIQAVFILFDIRHTVEYLLYYG